MMTLQERQPGHSGGAVATTWPPTKEELEKLYIKRELSAPQIADIYNKSAATIVYYMKKHGHFHSLFSEPLTNRLCKNMKL